MMGFGQGIGIFFVIRSLAGRGKEGVFYYGPQGTKPACWATSRCSFTPKDRGGGGRQKKTVFPSSYSAFFATQQNRKQDDRGWRQNQKYKWKHAFKRTTSDSKRGLIKKNIKPDEHFIIMIPTLPCALCLIARLRRALLRELRVSDMELVVGYVEWCSRSHIVLTAA